MYWILQIDDVKPLLRLYKHGRFKPSASYTVCIKSPAWPAITTKPPQMFLDTVKWFHLFTFYTLPRSLWNCTLPPSNSFPHPHPAFPACFTVYFTISPLWQLRAEVVGGVEEGWATKWGCLQGEQDCSLAHNIWTRGSSLKPILFSFFFSIFLRRGPSAVPWWTSCGFPSSASAGSNTSPSRPSWWKRRRSSTCTPSTTADCQGKRPWHEMGITFSPSLLQWGCV